MTDQQKDSAGSLDMATVKVFRYRQFFPDWTWSAVRNQLVMIFMYSTGQKVQNVAMISISLSSLTFNYIS